MKLPSSERVDLHPSTNRRACLQWLVASAAGALATSHAEASKSAVFYDNFRDMRLLDQEGAPIQLQRLLGRVALFNFVFTGCSTVCPLQTQALVEVQQKLAPDVRRRFRLVSVTLDPLTDTPAALKAYATRMGADLSSWSFVTGRHKDIERVSDTLRLFRTGTAVKRPDDHNTSLWLIDAQGQIGMRYSGERPFIPRLIREIGELDQMARASRATTSR